MNVNLSVLRGTNLSIAIVTEKPKKKNIKLIGVGTVFSEYHSCQKVGAGKVGTGLASKYLVNKKLKKY